MFRVIIIISLLAPGLLASAFSDVNRDCIADNTNLTSNDFLLGKWYRVYEFVINGLVPTSSCPELTFTKPTAEELQAYKDKYNSAGFPFTLDEKPILLNEDDYYHGLVSGNSEAKFYVLTPTTSMTLNFDGYEVNVFKRINENYVLFWKCSLRGNNRWLLARDRNAPHEEVLQIIASLPEVSRLFARRYCAP